MVKRLPFISGAFFGAIGSAPSSGICLFRLFPYMVLTPRRATPAYLGRRMTLLGFSVVFCVGAILTTVAGPGNKGLNEIYVGRVISGVGIGAISAVAPAYLSECAPKDVRGRITGMFQIFVAAGVALSYWVNCKCLSCIAP